MQNFSLFIYLTSMFHSNVSRLEILPLINDALCKQISSLVFTRRLDLRSININKNFRTIADVQPRPQDAGLWSLDSGPWTLDAGLWTLDPGRWSLDVGLWTLDAGL